MDCLEQRRGDRRRRKNSSTVYKMGILLLCAVGVGVALGSEWVRHKESHQIDLQLVVIESYNRELEKFHRLDKIMNIDAYLDHVEECDHPHHDLGIPDPYHKHGENSKALHTHETPPKSIGP